MKVVIWARVSSREQREGYSLDAQLRACRAKAEREGWPVVREFVVAETAKRGAERIAFNDMYEWTRRHARAEEIKVILSHKLDRICRNMRDAVRMQELEDKVGVELSFVDNEFGPGAAGALSFNVMAAVAQYYSDNLRSEVIKGQLEKARQGWFPVGAPYGYVNSPDRDEPIQPHPTESKAVVRIFELYSRGDQTFETLVDRLYVEGFMYRPSQPRFVRTALSYILNNRFYVGDLIWNGETFQGRHKPLVDRVTFDLCQHILDGKNRRIGKPQLALSGGLFNCAHCGHAVTGERIKKRLADGSHRYYTYYRCANNDPGPQHPRVRWREEAVEQAIIDDLASMRIPSAEIASWFRSALKAAFADITTQRQRQRQALIARRTELAAMKERLLAGYLGGTIDEGTFQGKSAELGGRLNDVDGGLASCGDIDLWRGDNGRSRGDIALTIFDWSQRATEAWRGSKMSEKRAILDTVSLNRTLSATTLYVEKRKPFCYLAERPSVSSSRGD
ncbi:MAG: hypothetical protein HBSAPP02_23680 [Phycisphaerae bacterium]|nr:MAG: hypothetical protein HBSAPP02_23680 [Phycisphaerae bacterium]